MVKKIMCILLAATLLLAMLPAGSIDVQAYTQIRDHQDVSGSEYSIDYAQKLDEIFAGTAQLFSNTSATFALGQSLNNRKAYQIAGVISGYQCYIYAQSVYYYLFGDIPYTGNGLVYWSNSSKIMENQSEASFESFKNANVGFGAYVRTTTNRDGSFNGSGGHSFIILGYDEEGITYLEGNADGYGLVCVTYRTWSEFNTNQLGGRNRKICHIVQHNEISYCPHEGYNTLGECLGCKQPFSWEATLSSEDAGMYRAATEILIRADTPYEDADAVDVMEAGTLIEVLGSCENAAGEKWYQILYNGQIRFVPAENLEYEQEAPLRVTCEDFSPSQRAVLEKKSQPVIGTVKSNYPLEALYAYLDGELYAAWYATDDCTKQVSLRQTDINSRLTFGSLSDGKHIIELEAYSLEHEQGVSFHKSVFYINQQPEEDTYNVAFDANGGTDAPEDIIKYEDEDVFLSHTAPVKEGFLFLGWATSPSASQPEYQPGDRFTANADTTLYAVWKTTGVTLSGSVTSYLTDGEVALSLLKDRTLVASVVVNTMTAQYSMEGLEPGTYTLQVSKENHTTRTYKLTIGSDSLVQDVKICPVGDVTGDGAVNVKDYQRLLRHVNKTALLEDYQLRCGDVTNDGGCSIKDYQRLARHINKTNPLY